MNSIEERKEKFENYKKQLDEDYLDLHMEDLEKMFDVFKYKSQEIPLKHNFKEFVDFVIKNSFDKDIFINENLDQYLDESSSDEEEEEVDDNYDDIYERK